jgi:hypothetical protein
MQMPVRRNINSLLNGHHTINYSRLREPFQGKGRATRLRFPGVE